jgi:hypothetical protein
MHAIVVLLMEEGALRAEVTCTYEISHTVGQEFLQFLYDTNNFLDNCNVRDLIIRNGD